MSKKTDADWRRHVLNLTDPAMTSLPPAPTETINSPTPIPGTFHSSPSFDPVELCPPLAAEKVKKLRLRKDDARRLIPEFQTVREASLAKIEAANALKTLISHPQDFGKNLPPTHPLVLEAQRALDKTTADFERLTELQEIRSAAFQSASQALAACEDWLRFGKPSGVLLQDHDGPEPKLAKENSLLDAVSNRRRRVRELRADIHRIRSAPMPSKYIKARLRKIIETLAERGTPDVSAMIEHNGDIVWPTLQVRSTVYNVQPGATAFHDAIDVVGLFAAILKPSVISFLDGLVDEEKDDPAALSIEAREKAEAEALGDLLAVEREESFFVWQAQQNSLPCEHRADCSQIAILNLVLIAAPRGTGLPPTSPEHSSPLRR
jgi:hypothetical protein